MDAQDELIGSDHTHQHRSMMMIKGKRTKRQRSSSPFVSATATTTTTTSSADTAVSSTISDCTDDDEDMAAICLIMLARGDAPLPPERIFHKIPAKSHRENPGGVFVYECKTCNRTFPSFQALGGHRASHKKPKTDEKTKLPLVEPCDEGHNCQTTKISSGLTTLTSPASNKPSKVHECSICGSEFTSGQALGGHMRRHRTATSAGPTGDSNPMGASPPGNTTEDSDDVERRMEEQRKYLPLDLNLPAPEDHDLSETKFQGLVFSATPALVDCHY